jgi:aspartyl-tRNA(Asn)/glutamyl-tRNA(Gln) amidotransferase subunit A
LAEWHEETALALGRRIETGEIDPRALTAYFLDRAAADPQRDLIYMRLTPDRARAEADAAYERAKSGTRRTVLDGVPLSWKDLFDTAGIATEGGSKLLKGRIPDKDAEVLQRATAAGTVCLGKTSMTEFAYSGLGYNPTCGSPTNPFDELTARVPGGSSGGAAVSLARGLAPAAIGTDTGGSVRIPAAWNNLVGLKTTFGLLPLTGTLPLSPTLDTIGPLTRDVMDAAALLAVLLGKSFVSPPATAPAKIKLRILKHDAVWSHVDDDAWPLYDDALERLERQGLDIAPHSPQGLDALLGLLRTKKGFVPAEAYREWGDMIEANPDRVFSMVRSRIMPGKVMAETEIADFRAALEDVRALNWAEMRDCDGIVLPTVGILPPGIEDVMESPEAYERYNLWSLFNTSIANQLGLCAITLPIGLTAPTGRHPPLPVGLMIMSSPFSEDRLLTVAKTLETALIR